LVSTLLQFFSIFAYIVNIRYS